MPYTQNLFPSTLLLGTPGGPGGGSGGGKKKIKTALQDFAFLKSLAGSEYVG